MAVTRDIAATYRGPGKVMARLLERGQREDRALAILMAGCVLVFIAQWPRLSRQAHLRGEDLDMLLGGALMAWLFIVPLAFYGLSALAHLVARLVGGQGSWYSARLALFWSFLASTPLILLHGLVAGFIGPGLELQLVGILWLAVFGWFWLGTMRQGEKGTA